MVFLSGFMGSNTSQPNTSAQPLPIATPIIEAFTHKSSTFAGGANRKSKRRHFNPRRSKTYRRKNIKK